MFCYSTGIETGDLRYVFVYDPEDAKTSRMTSRNACIEIAWACSACPPAGHVTFEPTVRSRNL